MYNIFTQWLTLSVIFFLIAYSTSWLEVVTLGGLILGAGIISIWSVIITALTDSLNFMAGYAAIVTGTAAGLFMLSTGLPGYTLNADLYFVIFVIFWGIFVKWQYIFLQRRNYSGY